MADVDRAYLGSTVSRVLKELADSSSSGDHHYVLCLGMMVVVGDVSVEYAEAITEALSRREKAAFQDLARSLRTRPDVTQSLAAHGTAEVSVGKRASAVDGGPGDADVITFYIRETSRKLDQSELRARLTAWAYTSDKSSTPF